MRPASPSPDPRPRPELAAGAAAAPPSPIGDPTLDLNLAATDRATPQPGASVGRLFTVDPGRGVLGRPVPIAELLGTRPPGEPAAPTAVAWLDALRRQFPAPATPPGRPEDPGSAGSSPTRS